MCNIQPLEKYLSSILYAVMIVAQLQILDKRKSFIINNGICLTKEQGSVDIIWNPSQHDLISSWLFE